MGSILSKQAPRVHAFREEEACSPPRGSIIDIGGSRLGETLKSCLQEKLFGQYGYQLRKEDGSRQHLLPSPLLSDDKGLTIWRDIVRLPHYYQTCDEVELFKKYGEEIAQNIPEGASILDLGCG